MDANNLFETGLYFAQIGSSNTPDGTRHWYIDVKCQLLNNAARQIAFSFDGFAHYERVKWYGSWSAWKPIHIERGSNANGEYVRFPDGTQICTGSFTGLHLEHPEDCNLTRHLRDRIQTPAQLL